MTKNRPLQTVEYALQECMDLVSPTRCAEAAGIERSYLYKFVDPDHEKKLSVARALLIDALCWRERGAAPFFELFRAQMEADAPSNQSLKERVLNAQAGLGHVAEAVVGALSAHGAGGEDMTDAERQAVLAATQDLKRHVYDIERAVTDASRRAKK